MKDLMYLVDALVKALSDLINHEPPLNTPVTQDQCPLGPDVV